jgi:hypothetical protein
MIGLDTVARDRFKHRGISILCTIGAVDSSEDQPGHPFLQHARVALRLQWRLSHS